jgi:hypothetical protein
MPNDNLINVERERKRYIFLEGITDYEIIVANGITHWSRAIPRNYVSPSRVEGSNTLAESAGVFGHVALENHAGDL